MLSSFMYCSVDEEENKNKSFLLCSGIYPGLDQRCLGIQKSLFFVIAQKTVFIVQELESHSEDKTQPLNTKQEQCKDTTSAS